MVFLVLTRVGFDELAALLGRAPSPVWVNAGALSAAEVADLRAAGVDLTVFSTGIGLAEVSAHAAETVREHHPGHRLWVEWEHAFPRNRICGPSR